MMLLSPDVPQGDWDELASRTAHLFRPARIWRHSDTARKYLESYFRTSLQLSGCGNANTRAICAK